jgi:hypothetical protein
MKTINKYMDIDISKVYRGTYSHILNNTQIFKNKKKIKNKIKSVYQKLNNL